MERKDVYTVSNEYSVVQDMTTLIKGVAGYFGRLFASVGDGHHSQEEGSCEREASTSDRGPICNRFDRT